MRFNLHRLPALPICTAMVALLATAATSIAQITLDGTLGPKGSLKGPDYLISANMGQQVGGNLFHSFGQFNVHQNESATFTGPASVENVIGRVTGGSLSLIDGRLSCDIPNTNLYLINPSGVMFGPNATLDVHGSVAVSTADYVRLGDTGRFDARQPSNSVLISAPPAAFGFLGDQPAPIAVDHSQLAVPEGKTISMIGGDFTVSGGSLSAPSGRINIASVGSAGEVIPNAAGQRPALDTESFIRMGNITASDGASISTTGEGGGTIIIRGGRFELQDASTVAAITTGATDGGGIDVAVDTLTMNNGAQINSSTFGAGHGGSVTVKATDSVAIAGENLAGTAATGIGSQAKGQGNTAGDAGAVTLQARTIELSDGGEIGSGTFGGGRAGTVTVTATDSIAISGETREGTAASGIFSTTEARGDTAGDGGTVTVQARTLALDGGAEISSSSFGGGQAGSVTVTATDSIAISGETREGTGSSGIFANAQGQGDTAGDGGAVTVRARALALDGGAQIGSASFGVGRAGTVTVSADSIAISGETPAGTAFSGIGSNAEGRGDKAGDAGAVMVEAQTLTLDGGAEISSNTFGVGRAGTVTVTATDSIAISGENRAGTNPTSINSVAAGLGATAGDAGAVMVQARTLTMSDGAQIDSSTFGAGRAGTVTVMATDSIAISGVDRKGLFPSSILSTADGHGDTAGDAGAVMVEAPTVTLDGGAEISSSTFGPGHAGVVTVNAADALIIAGEAAARSSRIVSSTDAAGDGGTVSVEAGELTVTGGGRIGSDTNGAGKGGTVIVDAQNLSISDGGALTAKATDRGRGGDIEVHADSVILTNGATIGAQSSGPGDAGKVTIQAADAVRLQNASITTAAAQAFGGSISVNAGSLLDLDRSAITTSVRSGSGDGGNIVTSAPSTALDHSQIIARADVGNGGNITIDASAFVASPDSVVDASSNKGINGTVSINSPETNISGALSALPHAFLQADALLSQRCAARAGARSSFVVVGRDALSVEPDGSVAGVLSPGTYCP